MNITKNPILMPICCLDWNRHESQIRCHKA